MFKCLYAWTLLRPGAVILKLDFKNAYNSAIRSAILREISSRCPHLPPIAQTIIADETLHWWFGEHAVAAAIHVQRGVDQGCPFSPALFATLIAGALERVRAGLRILDESAAVLSYLDEIYIVVSPEHAGRALNYVEQAFSPLSLTLNVAKCKWWCGRAGVAPTGLPATVQRAGVLPVLGSSLPYVVASELEHLDLLDADAPLA